MCSGRRPPDTRPGPGPTVWLPSRSLRSTPGGRVEFPGPEFVEEAVNNHRLLAVPVDDGHAGGVGPRRTGGSALPAVSPTALGCGPQCARRTAGARPVRLRQDRRPKRLGRRPGPRACTAPWRPIRAGSPGSAVPRPRRRVLAAEVIGKWSPGSAASRPSRSYRRSSNRAMQPSDTGGWTATVVPR